MIGHLTRDPETKQVGDSVLCKFTIAMNHRTTKGDDVCFVDVTVWGKQADFVSKYFSKGKEILVEGRLKTESWEKDGKQFSKNVIVGEKVSFVGKSGDNRAEPPMNPISGPMMNETKRISDKIDAAFEPVTVELPF